MRVVADRKQIHQRSKHDPLQRLELASGRHDRPYATRSLWNVELNVVTEPIRQSVLREEAERLHAHPQRFRQVAFSTPHRQPVTSQLHLVGEQSTPHAIPGPQCRREPSTRVHPRPNFAATFTPSSPDDHAPMLVLHEWSANLGPFFRGADLQPTAAKSRRVRWRLRSLQKREKPGPQPTEPEEHDHGSMGPTVPPDGPLSRPWIPGTRRFMRRARAV